VLTTIGFFIVDKPTHFVSACASLTASRPVYVKQFSKFPSDYHRVAIRPCQFFSPEKLLSPCRLRFLVLRLKLNGSSKAQMFSRRHDTNRYKKRRRIPAEIFIDENKSSYSYY
jgi:hypothetical protein